MAMTDRQLEAELERLATSSMSAKQLAPRVTAIRSLLKQSAKRTNGSGNGNGGYRRVDVDEPGGDPFFEVDLLVVMASAKGYVIEPGEWAAGESRRVKLLERQARVILAAEDPPGALEAWRAAG